MKIISLAVSLIILAFIGYLAYLVFVIFFTNLESINSCSNDLDCVIVNGEDVCKTPISINKAYENKWNKKISYTHWLYELTNAECPEELEEFGYVGMCENNKCLARIPS